MSTIEKGSLQDFVACIKSDLKTVAGLVICRVASLSGMKKQVVFSSFSGKSYGDNPRYISEKLHELRPDIPIYWLVHKGMNPCFPDYVHVLQWPSLQMIRTLATSKVWVDSHSKSVYISKNRNQYYIETWHGGLGMKKIELDAREHLTGEYLKRSRHNTAMVDVFISNSGWLSALYRRAFAYKGQILECGYPKNDIFFGNTEEIQKKVYRRLGIDETYGLLLYAPTFRKNPDNSWFDIDLEKIHKTLEETTDRKWKVLVKMHPLTKLESKLQIPTNDHILDVTDYPDMQELIIATGIYITDYSSGIFDFSYLRRPGFLYASDLRAYEEEERGLYWKMEELPFPYASNTDEMLENIKHFDKKKYERNLEDYFNLVELKETGHAAETIAGKIIDILDRK